MNELQLYAADKGDYRKRILTLTSACNCNLDGSEFKQCNNDGLCTCKPNVIGDQCDRCIEDYFTFPNCSGIVQRIIFLQVFELALFEKV